MAWENATPRAAALYAALDRDMAAIAADSDSEFATGQSSTFAPKPTGTPDGTKYYRDDGTWAVPAGGVGPSAQTINAQTGTTYTLVAGDAWKLVTLDNAGAITCYLPQDSDATFAIGTRVDFAVLGTGMVTWVAGAGATVNGTPSLVSRAQYSAATAIKRAANTWILVGDLA